MIDEFNKKSFNIYNYGFFILFWIFICGITFEMANRYNRIPYNMILINAAITLYVSYMSGRYVAENVSGIYCNVYFNGGAFSREKVLRASDSYIVLANKLGSQEKFTVMLTKNIDKVSCDRKEF